MVDRTNSTSATDKRLVSEGEKMDYPFLADNWERSDLTDTVDFGSWSTQDITATGWFSKKAERRGKTRARFFELQGALIRYFRDEYNGRGVGQKGDILIIPYKTESAQLGRVLTITNPDRVYELEAKDPLQAAQWHGAIRERSNPGTMGWWLKKAENVGKTQERYFEVDEVANEIRYSARTGPDGKGRNINGKIRIHGKTVVLPCDSTIHIINLARSWELTSPTQDKSAVMLWAKRIQEIAARLRTGEAAYSTGQDATLNERLTLLTDSQPLHTSNQDIYTDEEWLQLEGHSEQDLETMMSQQIMQVKDKLQELKASQGGRARNYTLEELYADLPPLPTEAKIKDDDITTANYTSIRSLITDKKNPLETVEIYDSVDMVKHAADIGEEPHPDDPYDVVHMISAETSEVDETNRGKDVELKDEIMWEHWEIDREQIDLINLFGEGEFGEVWAGKLIGKGDRTGYVAAIAAKSLKATKADMKKEFLEEAQFMTRIHHPNLVNLYGVCTKVEPVLIVSELCRNGSLHEYLKGQRLLRKMLRMSTLLRFMTECCDAMAYLEDMDIIHRDLAARNVLLDKNLKCKIADFGMAQDVYGVSGKVFKGNPLDKVPVRWCAPEGLVHSLFSVKSDVWSFGVLMYEIVTHGEELYPGLTNQEVCLGVMNDLRLEKPPGCSESLHALMMSCWASEPKHRASFMHLHKQLTTDMALAKTAHKPKGLINDAAVIIRAQSKPTYMAIKTVLIGRYGKTEFEKHKAQVTDMLNK